MASKGVEVVRSRKASSGYEAVFTYVDEKATDVKVGGNFGFYVKNDYRILGNGFLLPADDSPLNYLVEPESWRRSMDFRHINLDENFYERVMAKGADGVWTCSIALPSCCSVYYFAVSYDGGSTWEKQIDDSGAQYSKFYVPYDYERQDDDWGWLSPLADSKKCGKVEYFTYEGVDGKKDLLCGVYTPLNYDAGREEPYKTLYLSHGARGDATDWFYLGNAANIADRQFLEGITEPFIIVTMSNSEYRQDKANMLSKWDYDALYDNLIEVVIPEIEKRYNVSKEGKDRAFAGLSRGAMFATEVFYHEPSYFGYYGIFSASAAWDWMKWEDLAEMRKPHLYLGAGFGDHLLLNSLADEPDTSVQGFKALLEEFDVKYDDFVLVPGGHDWFAWSQLLRNFMLNSLWK